MPRRDRWLTAILILAFTLRVIFALTLDSALPYTPASDDSAWLLANGYTLITGEQPANGFTTEIRSLNQPPAYFVFIGLPQAIFAPENAVIIVRLLQALLGTLICWFAYHMARMIVSAGYDAGARTAGRIAAFALAISPAFILESAAIKTETLYMFFVAAGVWAVMRGISPHPLTPSPSGRGGIRWFVYAGLFFGGAALTRSVFLGFPILLALCLFIIFGWRTAWKRVLVMLVMVALVLSTWTIYNLLTYQRLVIGGSGLVEFIYLGATGWDDPDQVDERLGVTVTSGQPDYTGEASNAILSDIPAYLARRVGEFGSAFLQPHGTTAYGGESLRELALKWWQDDRSFDGLFRLTQGDYFGDKLMIYVFHFAALIFGVVGIIACRRQWRVMLPMLAFIGYTLLVHLVLLALPRYLFPTMIFWWVLAGAGIGWMLGFRRRDL
jgi:4-amino-4-deoxy-L-arabinose transferase-like glycosyltransferase